MRRYDRHAVTLSGWLVIRCKAARCVTTLRLDLSVNCAAATSIMSQQALWSSSVAAANLASRHHSLTTSQWRHRITAGVIIHHCRSLSAAAAKRHDSLWTGSDCRSCSRIVTRLYWSQPHFNCFYNLTHVYSHCSTFSRRKIISLNYVLRL